MSFADEYINGIRQWQVEFEKRRKEIVKKLLKKNYTIKQIIDYFDYDNMVKNEPDYCPLYKNKEKCHDLEELNCFFCGCPYYEITKCKINSKYAIYFNITNDVKILDCSACFVPHMKDFALYHGRKVIGEIEKEVKNE